MKTKRIIPIVLCLFMLSACSREVVNQSYIRKDEDVVTSEKSFVGQTSSDLQSPITYTYQNHPYILVDGQKELAYGNYFTIELNQNYNEMYDKLQKALDVFGQNDEMEIIDFFEVNADSLRANSEGKCNISYREDRSFTPIRSDGRAFSFLITNGTYYGGAHGYTFYSNYNYDPITGKEINFTDVVKNVDKLPDIIVEELQKQNEHLVQYFEVNPEDRERIRNEIHERFDDNAVTLGWVIDYDGVWFNFEDYAMGPFAAGPVSAKIKFSDYPEVFTDTYNNYIDSEIPTISDFATESRDVENVFIELAE